MAEQRHSVTRVIHASPAAIFAVVSSPQGHVDIDGSGMLVAPQDASPVRAVGDSFGMNMDREPLGDFPLGKYEVLNTVTKLVPDEVFEWNISGFGRPAFGHVYGYVLEPVGPNETKVTSYCDWSKVEDDAMLALFPVVPLSMMEKSLEKLEQVVARSAT